MQIKESLIKMLVSRHYLVTDGSTDGKTAPYFNAYLLANFGVVVDKPALLTKDLVARVEGELHLSIPNSFYANPQDTAYFSVDELILEQMISYFAYGSDLGRIDIFKKDLPMYVMGDELKLRTFYIISEEEAMQVLSDIMGNYCKYTRPFSNDELAEFVLLYQEGFYNNSEICCRDNVFALLKFDASFARFLDKKDIVKMSVGRFGDKASFKASYSYQAKQLKHEIDNIAQYIPFVKDCPLSKKQAKYFNKIVNLCGLALPKESNYKSPDKLAFKYISNGDVISAAKVYANNGSMLERRLKMLLSRANPQEAVEILNMLPSNNPLVLNQLMSTLSTDNGEARTFTFYRNNAVVSHNETDYEAKYRKSKLNESTRKLLNTVCLDKIKEYYRSLSNLGKVYIADNFYKIGLPINTSASGKGLDVLPLGSRIPCTGNKVRTFVHWKNAFDIDSSLIVVGPDDSLYTMGWFSYTSKPFGNDILFSGDITGSDGAEFFDIDLEALANKGYKYIVQTFHGYSCTLDSGEIYAGYQNKDNLNTTAWDPKNIEMQFKVFGDSRSCVAFAIDVQAREVIILNQILESDERVVRPSGFKTIEKYLKPEYLAVNIGMVAECRGTRVFDPADADIILDDTYTADITADADLMTPTIIRSYETDKLVALINA